MRPDALFLAWGPGGVSSARIGQGVLGLLLDARFGILPYVPLLLLAAAGLVLGGARRFAVILPAALAYYLTVASADNWSGAVCNLGRYVMPIAPLGVALVGIAIARTSHRRGAVTLVLALASWTALLALALAAGPARGQRLGAAAREEHVRRRPAVHPRPLHPDVGGRGARARAADPRLAAADRGRGLVASPRGARQRGSRRLAAARARGRRGDDALVGFVLERAAPGTRARPAWRGAIAADAGATLFLEGASVVREDEAVVGPGAVGILVRAPEARGSLVVTMGGGWRLRPDRGPSTTAAAPHGRARRAAALRVPCGARQRTGMRSSRALSCGWSRKPCFGRDKWNPAAASYVDSRQWVTSGRRSWSSRISPCPTAWSRRSPA